MVAFATLCWSTSGLFVRALPGLDAWTINAYRGLNLSLVLGLWLILRHRGQFITLMRTPNRLAMFWFALFFALGTSMYIAAIQLASVAAVASLGATSALFAALIGRVWLGEKTSKVLWLAIAVAMGGVFLVASGESKASEHALLGSVIALGVALTFAIQSASLRRYRDVPMEPAYVYGGLAVFGLVVLLVGVQTISWQQYLLLLGMGAIQLALPAHFYIRGARHVTAVQMVLISMMDTVLNPLWVWLLVDERPTAPVMVGGALIVLAIVASTWWSQRYGSK
jgi:DME family drug/metabolite transporter